MRIRNGINDGPQAQNSIIYVMFRLLKTFDLDIMLLGIISKCDISDLFCQGNKNIASSPIATTWAAIELAKDPANKGKNIVAIMADTGERYLSTALFEE